MHLMFYRRLILLVTWYFLQEHPNLQRWRIFVYFIKERFFLFYVHFYCSWCILYLDHGFKYLLDRYIRLIFTGLISIGNGAYHLGLLDTLLIFYIILCRLIPDNTYYIILLSILVFQWFDKLFTTCVGLLFETLILGCLIHEKQQHWVKKILKI